MNNIKIFFNESFIHLSISNELIAFIVIFVFVKLLYNVWQDDLYD